MRIVWCTLQFLDYRIPVFEELSKIEGVEFYLIYNGDLNSEKIIRKTELALGERSIPLRGELSIGKASTESFANSGFRIPYQKGLIKKIKDLNPDVMISDGFFQWSYATLYLRALKKIPHVMCYERTEHTERYAQGIRKRYRKLASHYIDAFCCSGKLCGQYLNTFGVKEKDKTYGFMVADTTEITRYRKQVEKINNPEKSIESKIEKPVYLFVGQLIERKGVVELVKAWKIFSDKINNNAELIIVGEGHLKGPLEQTISDENINNIILTGRIPYEKIFDYYKNADIFIMPTLEDNWSLVVPEAMAAGLPVMTTIYNGCFPELIREENGWVFDSMDQNNFIESLEKSYKSRRDFPIMGKESVRIIEQFTPKTAAKSIYKGCLIAVKNRKKG